MDLLELAVGQRLAQVDPEDLRPDPAGHRFHVEHVVGHAAVLRLSVQEAAARMDERALGFVDHDAQGAADQDFVIAAVMGGVQVAFDRGDRAGQQRMAADPGLDGGQGEAVVGAALGEAISQVALVAGQDVDAEATWRGPASPGCGYRA